MPEGFEGLADAEEGIFQAGELDFRPGEIQFRGEDLEVGLPGGLQEIESPGLAEKHGVEAFSRDMLQAETAGGVGLGIQVDEEDSPPGFSGPGGQVDGGGGLAHASFLIHYGYDAHRKGKRRKGWVVEPIRRMGSLDLW